MPTTTQPCAKCGLPFTADEEETLCCACRTRAAYERRRKPVQAAPEKESIQNDVKILELSVVMKLPDRCGCGRPAVAWFAGLRPICAKHLNENLTNSGIKAMAETERTA